MEEFGRLSGSIDQIELDFVEREAIPEFLMKLSIQLHLSGLSLSNTVAVLEIFGIKRARSTVHNWIHKANLQPTFGKDPDHVAVDETVIQLNDDQYWLYTAVDPETNELLYTSLEPTTNTGLAEVLLAELGEKHDVADAVFLIKGSLITGCLSSCRLRFQIRETWKSERCRTCLQRTKTTNYLYLELFQHRLSRHSRRLAQIIQLRVEPAYLNTATESTDGKGYVDTPLQ